MTDRTKPHTPGKCIGGFANSVNQIKNSVRKYLGHARFTMARVTPNAKLTDDEERADDARPESCA